MVTFNVNDVKQGSLPKYNLNNAKNLNGLVGIGVESSLPSDALVFPSNNFMAAINTAYDAHLPLILSPDMLWLTIAHGVSQHINNNAEELRHQFVNHEGKKKIEVFEDSFIKGDPGNNWQHMFGQFSNEISEYIGKKRDLIVSDFSTTGPVELAASEVVLMEAMQKYFSYECTTCCGIPQITLLGTKADWVGIQNKVRAISEFGLDWWVKELEPIVDEFIRASDGNANKSFWQNIYKEGGGSGGPYLSGWSVSLFPYLKDRGGEFTRKNEFRAPKGYFEGETTSSFPIGLAKAPFQWNYYDEVFQMEIAAGFTGVLSNEAGEISPQIGWAVRDIESHVRVTAYFECSEDWQKQEKLREKFSAELQKLGWVAEGHDWGKKIGGIIPKDQLENAKKISGLTVYLKDEDPTKSRF